MKDNFIHVCFIIDESGSMYSSVNDVIGGFQKVIDEQKAETSGECAISLYKFNDNVSKVYIGKPINDVENLKPGKISWGRIFGESEEKQDPNMYTPGGSTAMFDGIGTAIHNIGVWLNDMDESERPSKNLIVIMTDGQENASKEYTSSKIKEMIKEQEEKYNWTFLYMGTDITTNEYADSIGITKQVYTTRSDYADNYSLINKATKAFRCSTADTAFATMDCCLDLDIDSSNSKYFTKTGINLSKKLS